MSDIIITVIMVLSMLSWYIISLYMIKLFSELFTNIMFISLINNEAFLEAVTELKNLFAVLMVRIVWYAVEQLIKNSKKRRNAKR